MPIGISSKFASRGTGNWFLNALNFPPYLKIARFFSTSIHRFWGEWFEAFVTRWCARVIVEHFKRLQSFQPFQKICITWSFCAPQCKQTKQLSNNTFQEIMRKVNFKLLSPILSLIVQCTKMIEVKTFPFDFILSHKSHMISFSIINVWKFTFPAQTLNKLNLLHESVRWKIVISPSFQGVSVIH